jgi:hypothetical protein
LSTGARAILAEPDATGTVDGAALLASGPDTEVKPKDAPAVMATVIDLAPYAETWRGLAAAAV